MLGYGQRDPLIEYKKEAYRLFNDLNSLIQKEVVYSIFKVGELHELTILKTEAGRKEQLLAPDLLSRAKEFSAPAKEMGGNATTFADVKKKEKNEEGEKIGRNDACPCGSGKKYKKCHGK